MIIKVQLWLFFKNRWMFYLYLVFHLWALGLTFDHYRLLTYLTVFLSFFFNTFWTQSAINHTTLATSTTLLNVKVMIEQEIGYVTLYQYQSIKCIFLLLEKSNLQTEHFRCHLAGLKSGNARRSTVLDNIVGEVVTVEIDLVLVVLIPLVDDSVIKLVWTVLSTFWISTSIFDWLSSCKLLFDKVVIQFYKT